MRQMNYSIRQFSFGTCRIEIEI
ncbi:YSIRK-type signal peptide-containing protein [Metabacillus niabensis]